jgi:hypothetical protein
MVLDLANLDATILQFDPDFGFRALSRRPSAPEGLEQPGANVPDHSQHPFAKPQNRFTSRDIALELLVERALDKHDQRLLRIMTKRVSVALRLQRENGVVRCQQGPGQYMLWEVAR